MSTDVPVSSAFRIRARRGSIYLLVLSAGLLLAVAGMSVLITTQLATRSAAGNDDVAEAAVLAESAVELGLAKMKANPAWRTTYTNNVATTPIALGRGTISFKLVDESDGNLSNNATDPVRVYGIGKVGKTTRVYSMMIGPVGISGLSTAMCFGGTVTLGAVSIYGSATISSNASINCTGTTLNATNLEAAVSVTTVTCTGTGTRKFPVVAKELPNAATVFDYYVANGTRMSGIPVSLGVLQITNVLISPTNNPFGGGTNPNGIYYVDCGGSAVQISAVRIVGTMVFRNCGGVTIQTKMNLEPAKRGYPVLMVEGNLTWKTNSTVLSDNATTPINFNPPGVPYPYNFGLGGGTSNSTYTDSYPTRITGIVYASGTIDGNSNAVFTGCIITPGGWAPSGSFDLTYDPVYYQNPPPGFLSTTLAPIGGTWRWEAAP